MRLTIPLLLAFLLAAFIACGPASGTAEKEGEPTQTATPKGDEPTKQPDPTTTITPTETPKPSEEPTKTPVSAPPQKPTETPKPTPTRLPSDPLPEPTPTLPPAAPLPPEPTPEPPYSGGLEGCRTLNMFSYETKDEDRGMSWCTQALMDDAVAHCKGTGTSEAERACGEERLGNVHHLVARFWGPCEAITDEQDAQACYDDTGHLMAETFEDGFGLLSEILTTVDDHPDIKQIKAAVGDCMVEQGYARPANNDPMPWQVANKTEQRAKIDRSLTTTDTQRAARLERWTALDQCATNAGLYNRQDELWTEEVYRLHREDPEQLQPLIALGLKDALDMEGPAPFLRLRLQIHEGAMR